MPGYSIILHHPETKLCVNLQVFPNDGLTDWASWSSSPPGWWCVGHHQHHNHHHQHQEDGDGDGLNHGSCTISLSACLCTMNATSPDRSSFFCFLFICIFIVRMQPHMTDDDDPEHYPGEATAFASGRLSSGRTHCLLGTQRCLLHHHWHWQIRFIIFCHFLHWTLPLSSL